MPSPAQTLKHVKVFPPTWKYRAILGIDLALVPTALLLALGLRGNLSGPGMQLTGIWPILGGMLALVWIVSNRLDLLTRRLGDHEVQETLNAGFLALFLALVGISLGSFLAADIRMPVFVIFAFLFFGLSVAVRLAVLNIDGVLLATPSFSFDRPAQMPGRPEMSAGDAGSLPAFAGLVSGPELIDTLISTHPTEFFGRNIRDMNYYGLAKIYRGKAVLVTGAGGSVGAELCRQLLMLEPVRIVLLDHSEAALFVINQELESVTRNGSITIIPLIGSICDPDVVKRAIANNGIDIVLHAAAHKHVPLVEMNEIEGLKNNILGTRILARAARGAGVERFVLVSSDKAVRPTNVMGASKRLAEIVVQDMASRSQKTLFSMVRFGNVLGSSGSVVPLFQGQIMRGGPVTLTHWDVKRYFMTASEAACLVLMASGFARGGDVFVLDMGKPILIRDLARQMIERAGHSVRDAQNPTGDIEIKETGMRPGEKLYEELLIGADMQTTPHPKIMRAQEQSLSEIEVANMLRDLNAAIASGSTMAARALVARWVEGYHVPHYCSVKGGPR